MKVLRAYIDTSVIGGCLDKEFKRESLALIDMASRGEIILVVSDLLAAEVARAPDPVKKVFANLPDEGIETVNRSQEAKQLKDKYIMAGIITQKHSNDAFHVAIATVCNVDLIVSWNFHHIVHLDKIKGFHSVNLREGYNLLESRSPKEIVPL